MSDTNHPHASERSGDKLREALILVANTECEFCGAVATTVIETPNGEAVACALCAKAREGK